MAPLLVGCLALAVLVAAAWVAIGRFAPATVRYTKGPAIPVSLRPSPDAPADLQARLEALASAYRDPMGIAVTDVTDGWTAQVAGGDTFPQQSVSKLWVAISVLQAVDEGRLTLDRQVTLGPEDRSVFYQPITGRIRGATGFEISIADLLRHALIESDNAANDKLIGELGGIQSVTATIARKGLTGVAVGGTERDVQTRTAGLSWKPEYGHTWIFKTARAQLPDAVRDEAQARYLAAPPDGATPIAITTALAALKRRELLSAASTAFMLDLMGEARTGAMRMQGGLTDGWIAAHKTGTGPDLQGASVGINDVGLLTAPDGRTYAVAVMIRQTTRPPSARHAIMQNVVRAVVAQWNAGGQPTVEGRRIASGPVSITRGF